MVIKKPKSKQQLVWNCIRVLKGFDFEQVRIVLLENNVSNSTIKGYLAVLVNVGYLIKTGANSYKLAKPIGGRAPKALKSGNKYVGIYDYNIGENVYRKNKIKSKVQGGGHREYEYIGNKQGYTKWN